MKKIKSIEQLIGLWNENYDPDTDFSQPINIGKVFGSKFILTWKKNKSEFTSLFVILKDYYKKGNKSWFVRHINNKSLFILKYKKRG